MRRLILLLSVVLLVLSMFGASSCKKSKTAAMAADTTSATQMVRESAQAETTPAPIGGVLAAVDTTRKAASDTSGAVDTTAKKTAKATTGDKGIGPVKSVKLGPIDDKLVAQGAQIFGTKCTVCHDLDSKKIGPPLRSVTTQQTPEYIMNMILNSEEMEKKDARIKKLVAQLGTVMSPQGLTEPQARSVLEYLRSVAKGK